MFQIQREKICFFSHTNLDNHLCNLRQLSLLGLVLFHFSMTLSCFLETLIEYWQTLQGIYLYLSFNDKIKKSKLFLPLRQIHEEKKITKKLTGQ